MDEERILNPATGRHVLKKGTLGRALAVAKQKKRQPSKKARRAPSKKGDDARSDKQPARRRQPPKSQVCSSSEDDDEGTTGSDETGSDDDGDHSDEVDKCYTSRDEADTSAGETDASVLTSDDQDEDEDEESEFEGAEHSDQDCEDGLMDALRSPRGGPPKAQRASSSAGSSVATFQFQLDGDILAKDEWKKIKKSARANATRRLLKAR